MARTALCIGINDYPGTGMDLAGCVNDAQDWAAELRTRGFGVRTLLDGEATRERMLQAIGTLVDEATPGDIAVITFSGHGTYVFDTEGIEGGDPDEADGYDEALCPFDVQETGLPITDDEIHALFLRRTPGARLVLIADSCHSGTVARNLKRTRFLAPERWQRRAPGAPDAPVSKERKPASEDRPRRPALGGAVPDDTLDDVLLAGCMEGPENFSYDAVLDRRANGAFTHHALRSLRSLPAGASYADWHGAICALLPNRDFPQTPQLLANTQARQRPVFE